jgi:hypothetical protein
MAAMNAEGWYIDPFGHHEARWFSDGIPTALVRDGGAESQDQPPNTPITGELERLPEAPPSGGRDLKRADAAETEVFDPAAMKDAASKAIDRSTGF